MSERMLWRLASMRVIKGYSIVGNTMASFRLLGKTRFVVLKQPVLV